MHPATKRQARAHRRNHFGLVLASALAGLGLSAQAQTGEGPERGADLSVSVNKVRPLCFQDRLDVTGVLAAREIVEVSPDSEGLRVSQILVEPLEEVAQGQVLARLARPDEGGGATASAPVRAPVAGVIVRSSAAVGMPASARQGPLFAIVAGGDIDLQADVPIDDLAKLRVGQPVLVKPLGLPEIAGKVRKIETGTSPSTQLGRVRIGLGPGYDLRVGTFARGVVSLGERCGVGVPYSAVSYEAEGTIVRVVNGDRVEARPVEVGLLAGDDAEILSGLSESDTVVTRAGAFVREGDRVNPIPVDRKAGGNGSGPR